MKQQMAEHVVLDRKTAENGLGRSDHKIKIGVLSLKFRVQNLASDCRAAGCQLAVGADANRPNFPISFPPKSQDQAKQNEAQVENMSSSQSGLQSGINGLLLRCTLSYNKCHRPW